MCTMTALLLLITLAPAALAGPVLVAVDLPGKETVLRGERWSALRLACWTAWRLSPGGVQVTPGSEAAPRGRCCPARACSPPRSGRPES